ncbi:MAG: hypothetical protein U0547_12250 [Dehalococcoidia bacterium]
MDLARARYLVSAAGREALAGLPASLDARDPLRLATGLRKAYPPAEASALAEQVSLRAPAAARGIEGMLLTAHGLEMMTHPIVAARRAARIAKAGLPVLDLTCGLGGDLRPAADLVARTAGLERDRVTAMLAAANVPAALVAVGDATHPPFAIGSAAVLLDPSRRENGPRRFDPTAFSPPWHAAVALAEEARVAVLKTAPGIEDRHIPAAAEAEFVQLGRSMREAALWFGEGTRAGLRRAVLLPGDVELTNDAPECAGEPVPPGEMAFDPESCLTRAGLVRQLGALLGARLMDEQVAYLTAPALAFHPMAATFAVLEVIPFGVARLRQRLRERGWRPTEVRRRAFPVEPEELLRMLGRIEGEPVTLLCTTLRGARTVIVGRRVEAPLMGRTAAEENCSGV